MDSDLDEDNNYYTLTKKSSAPSWQAKKGVNLDIKMYVSTLNLTWM